MRIALLILLATSGILRAHIVSMSNGVLDIDGAGAVFELQVPTYETRDLNDPERALLDHIHFSSKGAEARILTRSCSSDGSLLTCHATYLFNQDVDILTVQCELFKVLVANHVLILKATKAGHADQAFLDISFPSAELRFRPPSFWESWMRDLGNGLWRACSAIASILFLLSLIVAARTGKELGLLAVMFITGELAAAILGRGHQLSLQFLETASALTVAYLAVEVLLLPKAGQRWLVVAALGAFHGLYFAPFLGDGEASGFLSGVVLGEVLVLAALQSATLALLRIFRGVDRDWWSRLFAVSLVVIGLAWFVARLV